MKPRRTWCDKQNLPLLIFLMAGLLGAPKTHARQVWTGPPIDFSALGTDPNATNNQDRISPKVWLTRAASRGIFNIVREPGYSHFYSPADTEWAYGSLTNYAKLSYQTWESWHDRNPLSSIGQPAVLHLVSEDIYLSIKFTSWGAHRSGGFSYTRSTPVDGAADTPLLTPISAAMLGVVLAGLGSYVLLRPEARPA